MGRQLTGRVVRALVRKVHGLRQAAKNVRRLRGRVLRVAGSIRAKSDGRWIHLALVVAMSRDRLYEIGQGFRSRCTDDDARIGFAAG